MCSHPVNVFFPMFVDHSLCVFLLIILPGRIQLNLETLVQIATAL
jgi:hypothetical protein